MHSGFANVNLLASRHPRFHCLKIGANQTTDHHFAIDESDKLDVKVCWTFWNMLFDIFKYHKSSINLWTRSLWQVLSGWTSNKRPHRPCRLMDWIVTDPLDKTLAKFLWTIFSLICAVLCFLTLDVHVQFQTKSDLLPQRGGNNQKRGFLASQWIAGTCRDHLLLKAIRFFSAS